MGSPRPSESCGRCTSYLNPCRTRFLSKRRLLGKPFSVQRSLRRNPTVARSRNFLGVRAKLKFKMQALFCPGAKIFYLWKNCELLVHAVTRFRKIFSCRAAEV